MEVVNLNKKNSTIFLVNKHDLEKILRTGIIETTKDDDNKEKVYIISTIEDNLSKHFNILLLKNVETKKVSDSIKKIDSLIKYQNKFGKHDKYELVKISIEKYINKKIKKEQTNTSIMDIDKTILEEVLVKVVQTMVDKSENKINVEEKIVTEYIEEPKKIEDFKTKLNKNITKIESATCNNKILIISETENKVYLPYTIDELKEYIIKDKSNYKNLQEVIKKEFIKEYKTFFKNPVKARFIETYNLIRKREKGKIIIALFYAIKMMFYKNINSAIIAACKSKLELNNYLYFLKSKNTEAFEYFKIIYDVSPHK